MDASSTQTRSLPPTGRETLRETQASHTLGLHPPPLSPARGATFRSCSPSIPPCETPPPTSAATDRCSSRYAILPSPLHIVQSSIPIATASTPADCRSPRQSSFPAPPSHPDSASSSCSFVHLLQ